MGSRDGMDVDTWMDNSRQKETDKDSSEVDKLAQALGGSDIRTHYKKDGRAVIEGQVKFLPRDTKVDGTIDLDDGVGRVTKRKSGHAFSASSDTGDDNDKRASRRDSHHSSKKVKEGPVVEEVRSQDFDASLVSNVKPEISEAGTPTPSECGGPDKRKLPRRGINTDHR
ncbi:uncharacterized protein FOMMEDRAFT_24746 [Fomitiporia mediterranea MF3/22]|uniref:uncharacterized protein n=1 Tax=Fomitiporia mediterranea (strain MF3/22) TaxID=694068 RepID=UPI00044075DD|nr:uncharacterized protein FOMMEDRAFT_24746 [Fomitiporia mediterranea MF3/22]EJD07343.1 hypothetical protein FOMMEDRAFT_24746 [Fomitiporia mediterranea MF3/22]